MKEPRYATPTFKGFAIGFMCIIAAAFGVMLVTSHYAAPTEPPHGVDYAASPR